MYAYMNTVYKSLTSLFSKKKKNKEKPSKKKNFDPFSCRVEI